MLPGVVHSNMTRVSGIAAADPFALSQAESEGRRQANEYVRFLVNEVRGYEHAYLLGTAVSIGVRETRRLHGRYTLTRDDVLGARDFEDAIARCGAPVEDHDGGGSTIWEYVGPAGTPSGQTYGIPYRCLIPADFDNTLIAGRCLSATHDAHSRRADHRSRPHTRCRLGNPNRGGPDRGRHPSDRTDVHHIISRAGRTCDRRRAP